jgi:hypothetical protein
MSDPPSSWDVYPQLMKTAPRRRVERAGLRGSDVRLDLPSEIYWTGLGFSKSVHSGGRFRSCELIAFVSIHARRVRHVLLLRCELG